MTAAAGWQFDGSFLRGNTDFDAVNGQLWTQDLSASIKIIAARHDNHDEVLSKGIEATLNLDGLNSMRANLKMGGFKITGLAAATELTDIPTYGQTAGAMTFAADVLTLIDRNGAEIDNVSIPTGGGGTGTVTSVTAGAGLDGGTINVAGTISLETLDPGQTYSGGISGVVVDTYGRVTQVTTGAYANTDIRVNMGNLDNIPITSSTGTGDTLWGATEDWAGVMTAAHVTTLNNLAAGSGDPDQTLTGTTATSVYRLTLSKQAGSSIVDIPHASGIAAGVMSIDDITKFNGLQQSAPVVASSPGTAGDTAYDTSYFYVCVATDTWKRVVISNW